MVLRISIAAAALLVGTSAGAQQLPPYVTLPAQASVKEGSVLFEPYREASILVGADRNEGTRGRHYFAAMKIDGLPAEPSHVARWAPFKTGLTAAGWTVAYFQDTNPPFGTVHYQKPGIDHGVPAARLTARGYGRSQPIADNESPEDGPRTAASSSRSRTASSPDRR